jgi:hypothetical protein
MDDFEWTPEMQQRQDNWVAWERRKDDLATSLNEDEWQRLRLELRDRMAPHAKELVPTYRWAKDCPHVIDELALELAQDNGDERLDELHVFDENGELICLAEKVGEVCICGDDWCQRESEVRGAWEDFWWDFGASRLEHTP